MIRNINSEDKNYSIKNKVFKLIIIQVDVKIFLKVDIVLGENLVYMLMIELIIEQVNNMRSNNERFKNKS